MSARPILLLTLLLAAACDRAPQVEAPAPVSATVPVRPAPPAPVARTDWPLPAAVSAAQPDLIVAPDGSLLLSWIEPAAGGHALKFARYAAGAWSEPAEIARGGDWFVNWADTPHLAATADGALWAHWLQKSAGATYAYDVALVRSGDGGANWSKPVLVNDDGTPTEHGFVSLWPADHDRIAIAWLDGRHTAGAAAGHGGHDAHAGAMMLRVAQFDPMLQRHDERELDAMTCDCCQTDAATTARGPLLVYRDRTPEEIRDIVATRFDGNAWSAARRVHADGWRMPACPVNGPSVAAQGEDAIVGWYTAAGEVPALKLARSTDAGDTFAAPLTLDRGAAVQGRADVALDADGAWVLWMREGAAGQSLQLARLAPDLSSEWQRIEVAWLQGRGRATGFPQLALAGDTVYTIWTDVVDGRPRLHGARYGSAQLASP